MVERIAGPAYAMAVCALVLLLVHALSRGIAYGAMVAALRKTPAKLIWISILCTALSYAAIIARDERALAYTGVRVPRSALLLASFCGSALGNIAGFGSLRGASVRSRVYGALGVDTESIRRAVVFLNVEFGSGLAVFFGVCALLGRLWP
ncbi:MAG TPA: YbhN family protein, partial [Candidatus Binataceae bacterium]|nr:YbhN family protein [Candidatus Binataceae bacterium]